MGQPLFQARPLIERHGVTIFSANYSLYGDLSRRVMATLRTQVPALEVYSIDEAFFNLDGFAANTSAAATRPTGTSCRFSRRIDPRARREPTKREAR